MDKGKRKRDEPRHSSKSSRGGSNSKPNKSGDQPKSKILVVVGALGFIVAACALLIYALANSKPSDCDLLLKELSSGKADITVDPILLGECIESGCGFDFTDCKIPCPFGYQKDEKTQCAISCDCAAHGAFQGDIQFDEDTLPRLMDDYGYTGQNDDFSLFFAWGANIWNNIEVDGRYKIPYEIDRSLTPELYNEFETAIRNISKRTCLDYIPRINNEKDYIHVLNSGAGCSTYVGRVGGRLLVQLPPGCFFESTIQHELMHTMGFDHEQSRYDRDAYVDIFKENIIPHFFHNFDKLKGSGWKDLESEYDIDSGMHYPSDAFAAEKGKPTVLGKDGYYISSPKGQHFLSAEDFREIRLLYECNDPREAKTGEWQEWQSWSDCHQTCGEGKRLRFRHCVHTPSGEVLTAGCEGLPSEYEACNTQPCPDLTGEWEDWGPWGECSKSCDHGRMMRMRKCTVESGCAKTFEAFLDSADCYKANCETGEKITTTTFGEWVDWGNWMRCDVSCGKGQEKRYRTCAFGEKRLHFSRCEKDETVANLNGMGNIQHKECSRSPCPGAPAPQPPPTGQQQAPSQLTSQSSVGWQEWGPWTICDRTCGFGTQQRQRKCNGNYCPGVPSESQSCTSSDCADNAGYKSMFSSRSVNTLKNVCNYGVLYTGKINSDNKPDLLCIYGDGFVRIYIADSSSGAFDGRVFWQGKTEHCSFDFDFSGENIHLLDMNGDGLDDLVCHSMTTKELMVTYNQGGSFKSKVDWQGTRKLCSVIAKFADVDGDGNIDLVCGDENNPLQYIYFNTGKSSSTSTGSSTGSGWTSGSSSTSTGYQPPSGSSWSTGSSSTSTGSSTGSSWTSGSSSTSTGYQPPSGFSWGTGSSSTSTGYQPPSGSSWGTGSSSTSTGYQPPSGSSWGTGSSSTSTGYQPPSGSSWGTGSSSTGTGYQPPSGSTWGTGSSSTSTGYQPPSGSSWGTGSSSTSTGYQPPFGSSWGSSSTSTGYQPPSGSSWGTGSSSTSTGYQPPSGSSWGSSSTSTGYQPSSGSSWGSSSTSTGYQPPSGSSWGTGSSSSSTGYQPPSGSSWSSGSSTGFQPSSGSSWSTGSSSYQPSSGSYGSSSGSSWNTGYPSPSSSYGSSSGYRPPTGSSWNTGGSYGGYQPSPYGK